MGRIKVENNVPIPQPNTKQSKYPWNKMEVGDCFIVKGKYSHKKQVNIASTANGWAKRNNPNAKFTVRKDEKGIRIWRIN